MEPLPSADPMRAGERPAVARGASAVGVTEKRRRRSLRVCNTNCGVSR